jgi:hypothetical protein
VWDNLIKANLLDTATKAGLTKNWITYAEQLSRASKRRNILWLSHVERIFEVLANAGISAACIKGGALIGDVYHFGNRMLGDIDTLASRLAVADIKALLGEYGFKQGVPDPVTGVVRPMSIEKQRFWAFQTHILPKFTLETGDEDCPFLRFAVGFDFFDPGDQFTIPSEVVISRAVRKAAGSSILVLDDADTVINICCHIYREAVSATFAFLSDNWHIYKFCDLRRVLSKQHSEQFPGILRERVAAGGLQVPVYFSFHYAMLITGDPAMETWANLFDPGEDKSFLFELLDGRRRLRYDRPFADRLFETGEVAVPGHQPTWFKYMNDDEW